MVSVVVGPNSRQRGQKTRTVDIRGIFHCSTINQRGTAEDSANALSKVNSKIAVAIVLGRKHKCARREFVDSGSIFPKAAIDILINRQLCVLYEKLLVRI